MALPGNGKIIFTCLLSNRSAIGDGFLDLINNFSSMFLDRVVVVKTAAYRDDEFIPSVRNFWNFKIRKNEMTISGILDFFKNIYQMRKRFKGCKIFVYGISPLNHIFLLIMGGRGAYVWVHDPDSHPGASIFERLNNSLIKLIVQFFSDVKLVVSNTYLKDRVVQEYSVPGDRVLVFGFPYISSIVNESHLSNGSNDGENFDFLFFGRIEPYKGIDKFLKFAGANASLRFAIAGPGDLDRYSCASYSNVAVFNEYVSNSDLRLMIKQSRFCIFPYTSATGTQAVQTALSLGTRCIVSDIPTFKSIIPESLRGSVVFFGSDEELYSLGGKLSKCDLDFNSENLSEISKRLFSPLKFSGEIERVITADDN